MHLGALKDQTSSPIAASSAPTVGWYAETDTKNIQEMAHDEYPGPLLNEVANAASRSRSTSTFNTMTFSFSRGRKW